MKSKKVLKRIAKIEALISEVAERSSQSAPHVRELLRDAKAAIIRAKEAVQASSGTAKNPPAKGAKPPSKAMPEALRPKRKLSAAGRRAISEATKKRWAAERAKAELAIAKKATVKKAVAKRVAPVKAVSVSTAKPAAPRVTKKAPVKKSALMKAAKAPTRKVAKKARVTKAAVKAPDQDVARVDTDAKKPVETSELTVPESSVQ
jgi:hypothetical protein